MRAIQLLKDGGKAAVKAVKNLWGEEEPKAQPQKEDVNNPFKERDAYIARPKCADRAPRSPRNDEVLNLVFARICAHYGVAVDEAVRERFIALACKEVALFKGSIWISDRCKIGRALFRALRGQFSDFNQPRPFAIRLRMVNGQLKCSQLHEGVHQMAVNWEDAMDDALIRPLPVNEEIGKHRASSAVVWVLHMLRNANADNEIFEGVLLKGFKCQENFHKELYAIVYNFLKDKDAEVVRIGDDVFQQVLKAARVQGASIRLPAKSLVVKRLANGDYQLGQIQKVAAPAEANGEKPQLKLVKKQEEAA